MEEIVSALNHYYCISSLRNVKHVFVQIQNLKILSALHPVLNLEFSRSAFMFFIEFMQISCTAQTSKVFGQKVIHKLCSISNTFDAPLHKPYSVLWIKCFRSVQMWFHSIEERRKFPDYYNSNFTCFAQLIPAAYLIPSSSPRVVWCVCS